MASPKALMNTTSAEETTPPPPVVVPDGTVAGSQENQATVLDGQSLHSLISVLS